MPGIKDFAQVLANRMKARSLQRRYKENLTLDGALHICSDTKIIAQSGKIRIGANVSFNCGVHLTATAGGELHIGNNVSFNRYDIIICRQRIQIGNHVAFGPNVTVYDHDHIYDENGFEGGTFKTGDIMIGDNCWIASNVTILRGTIIGEGCVIGAGTVLHGNIPPHSIVHGNRELSIHTIEAREKK